MQTWYNAGLENSSSQTLGLRSLFISVYESKVYVYLFLLCSSKDSKLLDECQIFGQLRSSMFLKLFFFIAACCAVEKSAYLCSLS